MSGARFEVRILCEENVRQIQQPTTPTLGGSEGKYIITRRLHKLVHLVIL